MRNIVGMLRVGDEMKITVIRENKNEKRLLAVIRTATEESVEGQKVHASLAGAKT